MVNLTSKMVKSGQFNLRKWSKMVNLTSKMVKSGNLISKVVKGG